MPHNEYRDPFLLCPWGCDFRIALIDFRVEAMGDTELYRRVMASWGWVAEYGLVARCPGCGQQVFFTPASKSAVSDVFPGNADVLPNDWHVHAAIFEP